jgi:hypothetical protein
MKNIENFQNPPNNNPDLQSLEDKLNFNKSAFGNELRGQLKSGIALNFTVEDILKKINEIKEKGTIEDFVTLDKNNYGLHVSKEDNQHFISIFGNEDQKFKTFRARNKRVAGWIGKGDYSFGEYTSKDHWGVSVAEELKNTGLSDVLYDLKSLLDDQLEFEHVQGSNFKFLTFYIKKGYVPYSLIEANNSFEEKLINNDDMKKIIQEIMDSRKSNTELSKKDYAIKLRLDPKYASDIYKKIISI